MATLAFTPSTEHPLEIAGSARIVFGVMTLGAATGTVDIGLDRVYGGSITETSCHSAGIVTEWNHTSGNLNIQSATDGDDVYVMAWGR